MLGTPIFVYASLYSSAFQTRFHHGSKHYESLLDCSLGVHIVCHISYLRKEVEKRVDEKSPDWWAKKIFLGAITSVFHFSCKIKMGSTKKDILSAEN